MATGLPAAWKDMRCSHSRHTMPLSALHWLGNRLEVYSIGTSRVPIGPPGLGPL
jgi:hypothetical protein